jgi:hypothetical protein
MAIFETEWVKERFGMWEEMQAGKNAIYIRLKYYGTKEVENSILHTT